MENLKQIVLKASELENLPLFYKKLYYNQITDLDTEMELYRYSEREQSEKMRKFRPNKAISKIINYNYDEDND